MSKTQTHPDYDFAGYVTRNDMLCTDGVTIRHGAFKDSDGKRVPLIWQHQSNDPSNVIGHIDLHHVEDGVYGYGYLNDTQRGQDAKIMLRHGDVDSMSIGANRIKRTPTNDVIHGNIYEVSLVLTGANPGAKIMEVIAHSETEGENAIIMSGQLIHSGRDVLIGQETSSFLERIRHSEDAGEVLSEIDGVLDTLTEDQAAAVAMLVDAAADEASEATADAILEELDDDDDEELEEGEIEQSGLYGGELMHYNAFEQNSIAHAATVANEADTIKDELNQYITHAQERGVTLSAVLAESDDSGVLTHAMNNLDLLFPDHANPQGVQVVYSKNTGTEHVLSKVTKAPTAFVKSIQTDLSDLTDEQLRAKGYIKGNEKKDQIIGFLSRKTDPKTIYKKQSIDRDDAIDIGQNLNVTAFFYQEMRQKLNDEIAQAILVGDGRQTSDPNKIDETKIRPIKSDDDKFTIKKTFDPAVLIDIFTTVADAKNEMLGSGTPSLYVNPSLITKLRFLRNKNEQWVFGGQQPATKEYLASLFGVAEIVETKFLGEDEMIMVNLADYQIGTNKGGEVNTFEKFDIDYNKMKYLIETRLSGALTMLKSAVYFSAKKPGGVTRPGEGG